MKKMVFELRPEEGWRNHPGRRERRLFQTEETAVATALMLERLGMYKEQNGGQP